MIPSVRNKQKVINMCPISKGKKLEQVFFEYYDKKKIDAKDMESLKRLARAAHIEYIFEDGVAYAMASRIGRKLIRPSEN